jgi:hypothetical protein
VRGVALIWRKSAPTTPQGFDQIVAISQYELKLGIEEVALRVDLVTVRFALISGCSRLKPNDQGLAGPVNRSLGARLCEARLPVSTMLGKAPPFVDFRRAFAPTRLYSAWRRSGRVPVNGLKSIFEIDFRHRFLMAVHCV